MHDPLVLQGRELRDEHLNQIRDLLKQNPDWSRRRLSIELCYLWDWRNAKGEIKDMASRSLLVKLDKLQHITLPPRRQLPSNRMTMKSTQMVLHDTTPIEAALSQLQPLNLVNISDNKAHQPLYDCLLNTYHYLGYRGYVGENMRYLVLDDNDRLLACLLFGASAWSVASRDQVIGWSADQRRQNLSLVSNNTRFLILPWVRVPHLASHILGQVSRHISDDWMDRYGHPLYLLETFVEQTRFKGTCYRAANWCCVGQTQGRSRNDRHNDLSVPIKSVYLYPLLRNYRQKLCQDTYHAG